MQGYTLRPRRRYDEHTSITGTERRCTATNFRGPRRRQLQTTRASLTGRHGLGCDGQAVQGTSTFTWVPGSDLGELKEEPFLAGKVSAAHDLCYSFIREKTRWGTMP